MVDGGGGPPPRDPSAPPTPLRETVSDPAPLSADTLRDAALLDWTRAAITEPARALVIAAEGHSLAAEERGRARGAAEAATFRRALGAIIGASLGAWWRYGVPVSHSRKLSAFTEKTIGARTALAALDALTAAGLLVYHPGFRREVMPGSYGGGWASRWHPTAALMDLAETHGVAPGTIADAFRRVGAETIRPAPPAELVEVKPLGKSRLTGRDLADAVETVAALNERAAAVPVRGCSLPVFRRTYHGAGHGRFYVLGGAHAFQHMRAEDRLRDIIMDGEAIAEVDTRASHLTIMHALAGLPLPDGDLYAFPGIPRDAVKAFVTMTIGTGKPAQRWARDTGRKDRWPPLADIRAAVFKRMPFMRCPALLVPPDFAPGVGRERALSHYLTRLEADALATAMGILWRDRGTLALPLHDCLLVPRSAASKAAEALRTGYLLHTGEEPRMSATWWQDGRKASEDM